MKYYLSTFEVYKKTKTICYEHIIYLFKFDILFYSYFNISIKTGLPMVLVLQFIYLPYKSSVNCFFFNGKYALYLSHYTYI